MPRFRSTRKQVTVCASNSNVALGRFTCRWWRAWAVVLTIEEGVMRAYYGRRLPRERPIALLHNCADQKEPTQADACPDPSRGLLVFCIGVRVGKKTPAEFKPGPGDDSSGACFPICKLSTGDGGTCRPPPVYTSGTPGTRPDAVGHNMMVLAQGVEP
jgi:hypothetical protein